MPVYVVTGCSSGIGLELVKQLAAAGHTVFATCRKRESSVTGVDLLSAVEGDVTVLEGIDVTNDNIKSVFAASSLAGKTIDVLIHNAGSYSGEPGTWEAGQGLDDITMDRMRKTFELNTLGPLRVQQALNSQMRSPGGKIGVISTGLSSISDNSSGGKYAYRTSKAGVNMVARSIAMDLKEKGIWCAAIAPGFVATEFGPGRAKLESWGAKPVDRSVVGILEVVSALNEETTGKFFNAMPSDGGPFKEYPW